MARATSLEHVLQLFDSVWFHNQILQDKYVQECSQKLEEEAEEPHKPQEGSTQILKVRSHSENLLLSSSGVSFLSDSQSPTSVLPSPRLQTIFSGKEVSGFDKPEGHNVVGEAKATPTKPCDKKNVNRQRRKHGRGGKWSSKSLTDLEFEELKGFKDLGFVFSEEDQEDPDLVSIVPGLQRLRRRRRRSESNDADEKMLNENNDVINVERPYLSEAWSVMEKKKKKKALIRPAGLITIKQQIRQGSMENEMLMKHQIKCWAHSVATAIR